MQKFQAQIIITTNVFWSTIELLLTSITMATGQYSQNWWGQIFNFIFIVATTKSQMPIKWTLEACTSWRSINQLETLHEYNFEKYEQIAQFSDCNI